MKIFWFSSLALMIGALLVTQVDRPIHAADAALKVAAGAEAEGPRAGHSVEPAGPKAASEELFFPVYASCMSISGSQGAEYALQDEACTCHLHTECEGSECHPVSDPIHCTGHLNEFPRTCWICWPCIYD